MVFSSTVFLFLFLPALLVLYYLFFPNSRIWKNAVLLSFSILFYAWGEPVFVVILLFSIIVNWLFVMFMERREERGRKPWMIAAIAYDTALLVVFKYASFLSRNMAALTGNRQLIVNITLPIGISFFTFQMMSYVFDVYYRRAQPQKNPLYVVLYISLFPQLIAGPIVRYQQIETEISRRSESFQEVSQGIRRFVYGLAKKVLLANYLAQVADTAFDYPMPPSVLYAWLGAIAYALQIYFDFSGYSDMAIGLGRMFGFHFAENFNYPYIAGNLTDFWRRWHISLGAWFRDYVYIPLGGSRGSRVLRFRNLLIVWLLTGIWHGANWTFVVWGLLHFAALMIEKKAGTDKKQTVITHIYTLLVFILTMVFFRADDLFSGVKYIAAMFGKGCSGFVRKDFITTLKSTWTVFALAIPGSTPFVASVFGKLRNGRLSWMEDLWLTVLLAASVLSVVSSTYNPFIYFSF